MKRTILTLALVAASLTAQAQPIDWVSFTGEKGNAIHVDRATAVGYGAIGALAQDCRVDTQRCERRFIYIEGKECQQGFGYIRWREFDGSNSRKGGAFILGGDTTIADAAAEFLCDAYKAHSTTTARKSK